MSNAPSLLLNSITSETFARCFHFKSESLKCWMLGSGFGFGRNTSISEMFSNHQLVIEGCFVESSPNDSFTSRALVSKVSKSACQHLQFSSEIYLGMGI